LASTLYLIHGLLSLLFIMKRILFITGCLGLLILSSCKKEVSENFNLYTGNPLNDTVWTRSLSNSSSIHNLFDNLVPDLIVDSFEVSSGKSLRFGDSLEISFNAGSCVGQGSSVPQGFARLELIPMKRKGDFIRMFRPTVAENGSLLETGGGFFIRVSKDGKDLALAPNATFKLKFNDVDLPASNMQLFYGREGVPAPLKGIDTAFYWVRDFDTTSLKTWEKISNNPLVPSYRGYELNSLNLRWVSANRYVDSTLPKTKVTAVLPPNFTNKNTVVFAVFANQKTVVNLKGDYPSRSFNANNIPLQASIKLISLSKIGGDYYIGIKDISSVEKVTSYKFTPGKISFGDLIRYLNNL